MSADDGTGRTSRGSDRLSALRETFGKLRPFGTLVGVLLLVGAVAMVLRDSASLADALATMAGAPRSIFVALLGSVLLCVALTGATFWFLTRRYGRVGFVEMQALMSATALVNYLPLRPGLLARVAYHRSRNEIRARDSLRTIVEAMLLSLLALALLVPLLLGASKAAVPAWAAAAVPLALALPVAAASRSRSLGFAFASRYAETLLTTVRYDLAFRLVGVEMGWHGSAAIACVSMIATMVPFVSNGLGLREWAIGLMAPLLVDIPLERGLVAELINRAAEILVIVPSGLVGAWWLWRRRRSSLPSRDT